jgi:hypothetical protein
MAKNIQIKNKVLNKEQLDKVVDRNFNFFAPVDTAEEELTVDEFFTAYDSLYYEIPIEGDSGSHAYLIKKSSELADYDRTTEDIQPLLDEIATLRRELLNQQQIIIDLNTRLASEQN